MTITYDVMDETDELDVTSLELRHLVHDAAQVLVVDSLQLLELVVRVLQERREHT